MNVLEHRDASFLSRDEASAIEAALRTALVSILKVFCEVNENRSRCYEVKLAQAERENTALKFQLQSAEQELQYLRQNSSNYKISAEVNLNHDFIPETNPGEEPTSFHSNSSLPIKEEPCSESMLCLKTETAADETFTVVCDYPVRDNVQICQQNPDAEMWRNMQHLQTSPRSSLNQISEQWNPGDGVAGKLKSRECVRRYRERIRADPEKYHAWKEKERLRYHQKKRTINELSEPMKKMKRMAWRDAKRRNRAKRQGQISDGALDVI